jgi:WD40 repeat protein
VGIALAMLAGLLVLLAVLGARRLDPSRPVMGNGPILVETHAFDPVTGLPVPGPCPACGPSDLPAAQIHSPSWSADGTKLAFIATPPRGIVVTDVTTGVSTDTGACVGCGAGSPSGYGSAAISADGRSVAYVEDGQVKVLDVASRATRTLTDLPDDTPADSPTFSPDGRRIAFSMGYVDGLWTVDADGSTPPTLLLAGDTIFPAWSPDGSTIAFVRGEANDLDYQLWLHDLATGSSRMAWHRPQCCLSQLAGPAWSPDGRSIALMATDEEHAFVLWRIDLPAGTPTDLGGGVAVSRAAWQPVPAPTVASPAPSRPAGRSGPPMGRSAPPASATPSLGACDTVRIDPKVAPPDATDTTGLRDGIAVGIPYMTGASGPFLDVATGSGAPIERRSVTAADGVAVDLRPLRATSRRTAVMLASSTDIGHPLSDCDDLWQVVVDAAGSDVTRLTAHHHGQRIRWSDVSPSGRHVALELEDTSGAGWVEHLTVLDVDAGTTLDLGDTRCADRSSANAIPVWSPTDDRLAIACDGALRVIDLASGESAWLDLPAASTVTAMVWQPAVLGRAERILATASPAGVNGPLTVVAIDPTSGATQSLGTWGSVDGQPLDWLGGSADALSPDGRYVWSLGDSTAAGATDPAGYLIDLERGTTRLLMAPDERPDQTTWVGDRLLGTFAGDNASTTLQLREPTSDLPGAAIALPAGTWAAWVR